ncbi:MAG: 30S ribosomal protein S4 [Alphaproteobacteria bacterium]|nr:30S ribosomal protein S4 [Alphaproteobacteria bacterium]
MSKRETAKFKINRRHGCNHWGRAKSPLNKRDYRPGQHGQRRNKLSDFGQQLMAKQKLKGYYGNIGERQFRRYYFEALRRRGDSSENLIQLLESRLDTVVYRMKFAASPFASRQLINHGHVKVNGKRVNIASYLLKQGDVIELREKSRQMTVVLEASQSVEREVPEFMSVDHKDMKGTFTRVPSMGDVPYPVQMEPALVIEFYSR